MRPLDELVIEYLSGLSAGYFIRQHLVIVAIFIFGGESIRGFVFALLIGIFAGTYSSLFIASPIACSILKKKDKKNLKK